jgi:glycosyltransferase involved in cell wall biosynthesis
MCALIGMAVYSNPVNKKDDCLHQCLASLADTVDWKRHRLILSINDATEKTHDLIRYYRWIISDVIYNTHNLGTARAINKCWSLRAPGEHCIKMDDDVVIHDKNWADLMEEAIARDPLIGQCGLKRRDCWEKPQHENPDFRSELIALPHTPGQRWITVEKVKHVIGTCVMHNSALIDVAGALFQYGQYGYDDVIYSHKCYIAGFYSCFLPHINIEHIDPGDTPYQDWKHKHSGQHTQKVIDLVHDMRRGKTSIYHPFE